MSDLMSLPVGQPPPGPPPSGEAAPPDFSKIIARKPKRGGLPLELVAAIQKTYKEDAQAKNPQTPAEPQALALDPGWGGKGL